MSAKVGLCSLSLCVSVCGACPCCFASVVYGLWFGRLCFRVRQTHRVRQSTLFSRSLGFAFSLHFALNPSLCESPKSNRERERERETKDEGDRSKTLTGLLCLSLSFSAVALQSLFVSSDGSNCTAQRVSCINSPTINFHRRLVRCSERARKTNSVEVSRDC
jgi:hypothetical protein